MKPYGQEKHKTGIHPHNECGICSSKPPTKGQVRMRLKRLFRKFGF